MPHKSSKKNKALILKVAIGELYGYIDPLTLEWCDGVFGNAIRSFANGASSVEADVYYQENFNSFILF